MAAIKSGLKAIFGKNKESRPSSSQYYTEKALDDDSTTPHIQDEEIIAKIEDMYFDKKSEVVEEELTRLESFTDISSLERRMTLLATQERAVSSKLVKIISANHFSYVQEMESVLGIEEALQEAHSTCTRARSSLATAQQGISEGTMGLLSKHRQQIRIDCVFTTLKDLKQLRRLDCQFENYLEAEMYSQALNIVAKNANTLRSFKEFDSISALEQKFSRGTQKAEIFAEEELKGLYEAFDPDAYSVIHEVLELTGKTEIALRQTVDSFKMGVRKISHATIVRVLRGSQAVAKASEEEIHDVAKQFPARCKELPPNLFSSTLRELAKEFFKVTQNYCKLMQWYTDLVNEDQLDQARVQNSRRIVIQELKQGAGPVWKEIERQTRIYLEACDFLSLKYDDVISVLEIVQKLNATEFEFTGSKSSALLASVRQLSLKYFKNYHRSKLESLNVMMNNEAWVLCPVEQDFSLVTLPEFKVLRRQFKYMKEMKDHKTEVAGLFKGDSEGDTPFDEEEDKEDSRLSYVMEDDSYDMDKLDTSDFMFSRKPSVKVAPIVSNPSLTVMRLFGDYMQMMTLLDPIAFDVLKCMTHLFDYLLYTVFIFFSKYQSCLDNTDDCSSVSWRLEGTLKRIGDMLILGPRTASNPLPQEGKVQKPVLFFELKSMLDDPSNLYGFRSRLVALESLVFLASEFQTIVPTLEKLIPESKHGFLSQYNSQTVFVVQELREPIYEPVFGAIFSKPKMISSMASVRWDIKELLSEHSPFVDELLQDVRNFKTHFEDVEKELPLSDDVKTLVWKEGVRRINIAFVDGFSQAKSCSNEGRALMQLDYQQFLTKLKSISDIRQFPQQEYVEQYIKAYYLSEQDLIKWIQEHKEYSQKQLNALIHSGVGSHIGKKAKQKLLSLFDYDDRQS